MRRQDAAGSTAGKVCVPDEKVLWNDANMQRRHQTDPSK